MTMFSVDTDALKLAAGRCEYISVDLGNLARQISSVKDDLNFDMGRYGGVMTALDTCAANSYTCKNKVRCYGNRGVSIANRYSNTENSILGNIKGGSGSYTAGWQTHNPSTPGGPNTPSDPSDPNTPGTNPTNPTEPGTDPKEPFDPIKALKTIAKTGLDVLGKAGKYGKEAALPIALAKCIIDGDGITPKDIGNVLKGMGNSMIGMCEVYAKTEGQIPGKELFKELAGLSPYKTLKDVSKATAGWASAGKTFGETLKNELAPTGTKVAGWGLALLANGFANYEEYQNGLGTDKEISKGRAVAETISETLIDIGKGALITAGIAAGCAAIGVAAPAVVVGGAAVAVSTLADVVCKRICGKGVTEAVSDFVLDNAPKVAEKAVGAVKAAGKVVSGWADKIGSGISSWFSGG